MTSAYRRRRLRRVFCATDFEAIARRRMPRAVWDSIEGGVDDERTIASNRQAIEDLGLRPRSLADVSNVDPATTVLGQPVSMPLLLAPTAAAQVCDPEAEAGVARAAANAGTVFALGSAGTLSPEAVAGAGDVNRLWYQAVFTGNERFNAAGIDAAEQAGYRVLCMTVDGPGPPRRERDLRNGIVLPMRPTARLVLSGMTRPAWTIGFLSGPPGREFAAGLLGRGAFSELAAAVASLRPATLEDIRRVRERWPGKLVIKGVMRGDEVPAMIDAGVDGIVVSNHGGRNIETGIGTFAILPEVVEAARGAAEVFVDGGVRRGTDVVKALALGARACFIGRPYLWALTAAGSEGVDRLLQLLRVEIETAMKFCGCATVHDVDASIVRR